MKGLTVIRAMPSNAIDIYPLLEQAAKEGVFDDSPTGRDLKNYYFNLLNELKSDFHFWYLAKRGRGFLGFLHAVAMPRRWDGQISSLFIDTVFVVENRRKMGIGRKLIDELMKDADHIGIKRFEFASPEDQTEHWVKELKAKKSKVAMRVDL